MEHYFVAENLQGETNQNDKAVDKSGRRSYKALQNGGKTRQEHIET